MDSLQLPHAKLFYFVSELWKRQEITDTEKTIIKEMIINDEPAIFNILEEYEESSDERQLRDSIIELVRPQEKKVTIDLKQKNFEPPEQDDVSSPLGNSLFERKKRHNNKSELTGLAEALRPTDTKA